MLCANCDNKGVFTTMTAIGEKAFCCEKCYAEYVGLPVEKEGYYGFMAETFEASVVHRGKKPKGAIGKAMMNRAMIERAEIESVIQELENKVQLGIISEDDLMKSLTQRFGAEFEVIDWNNLHDTNRELFVQKLQEYYDDFKENNPELHKEFEERIMNEESWYGYERGKSYAETKEKWTKKLSDLGYEYERIDDYWEYIGYDNTPVYEHCNYCDGEGIIITKYYPATREDPADADYVDCEMCEGKGKVLEEMNAETFEDSCFRCGCKGDYDDGDEINLLYCELCDDYWCNDACREPSCWDRHYNYTCTRNAAENFGAEAEIKPYMKIFPFPDNMNPSVETYTWSVISGELAIIFGSRGHDTYVDEGILEYWVGADIELKPKHEKIIKVIIDEFFGDYDFPEYKVIWRNEYDEEEGDSSSCFVRLNPIPADEEELWKSYWDNKKRKSEKSCSHENLSIKTMEVLNGELLLTLDCDNCGKRTSTSASLNQDSFYAEEVKLSKTSCCCGATESNPCACMKAPEPMNCSATEPKCPCYKDLEKNAEYDDGYDPCEECGVHLGDYYVCPYCYPEEFEELDAETYNAEEKGKRKIGETVAWNNRIIGMDGKWLDGKYDLYEIGNQIGYAVVHQDLKSFEYKLEQNGVLLGSKGTDIAQISFAGLNIYTGGDGSFPIVGLYEDIEEYYSRTQNKPHPTKNLSIDEELENYEKNNYLEAKWEDEFTEWAKTVYDFKPQYYSDGTEISLSYYEAKRILQENHKVLVGARITIRNPSMPNLERQNSKSSVWVLEYPDIRKITQGQNGRIKRETNTIFINTEKTVNKIFANLQKKYPKGMISEGRYGKSFIISIPFFGKYRWDANKYNLVYDSLSDEEKKRRESLESKKRQKEYEQKRKEQQEALKAKYGAEEGDDCPNCHCEHQNLSLDGTPDVDEEYVSVNVVCDDCGMKGYTTTYPYEWDNEAKLEDVGLPLAVNMNNPNYGELRCSRCRERFEKSAENYVLDVE